MVRRLLDILEQVDDVSGSGQRGMVVLQMVRESMFFGALATLLSDLLSKRGYRTAILLDDGQLAQDDVRRCGLVSDRSIARFLRRAERDHLADPARVLPSRLTGRQQHIVSQFGRWLAGRGRSGLVYTSQALRQEPLDQDEFARRWNDAKAKQLSGDVLASHRRFFGGRPFDPDNPQHVVLAGLSIKTEMVWQNVARWLVRAYDPTRFITLDGTYVTFAPLLRGFQDAGIGSVVIEPMILRGRDMVIRDQPYTLGFGPKDLAEFHEMQIPPEPLAQSEAILSRRTSRAEAKAQSALAGFTERISKVRGEGKRVVAAFPNVSWDGALVERDTLFESIGHWLCEIARWARNSGSILIIREHPRRAEHHNRWESTGALMREMGVAPDSVPNVWFIEGTEPVSSFSIVPYVDLSLVYSSTIGMEIAYQGYPVSFAGRSPYTGMGLAFEPQDRDEYFRLLEEVSPGSPLFTQRREEFQRNAVRAFAYHFFLRGYYCPLVPRSGLRVQTDKQRYWVDWDLAPDQIDPQQNTEWEATLNALLGENGPTAGYGERIHVDRQGRTVLSHG
jgi:hypothetical protein